MVRGGAQKKTVIRSVRVPHLAGHHLEELGELDLAGAVGVNVGDHLLELLLLDLEAEGAHGGLELTVVNRAGVVRVKKVEGLADLLDLLLRKSGLLGLASSGGSTAHDFCEREGGIPKSGTLTQRDKSARVVRGTWAAGRSARA